MKKLILILGLLIAGTAQGQELVNFYLEPSETNMNAVTLHTAFYYYHSAGLEEYEVYIDGNEINFNLCYGLGSLTVSTYEEREFEIVLPAGISNFDFNIKLSLYTGGAPCNSDSFALDRNINFDFPYNPNETIPIPDTSFEGYIEAQGFGDDVENNGLVYAHRFVNITRLPMSGYDLSVLGLPEIEDLTGIEQLYGLRTLRCNDNSISNFDATLHPELYYLVIDNNPLNVLDTSNCPDLYVLQALNTNVSTIDFSNNPDLLILQLGSSNITSLDLSQNLDLRDFGLTNTSVTELDLTNNTNLQSVTCHGNQNLSSLIIGNTPEITTLNLSENALVSVDLSGCSNLRVLNLDNNELEQLDLSFNLFIDTLIIQNNDLNSLNLKNLSNNAFQVLLGVNNPNLFCVDVDNPQDAPYYNWFFDPQVTYDDDCSTDDAIFVPDINFFNALVNNLVVDTIGDGIGDSLVDTNGDGLIQESEAQAVINLIIPGLEIESLEGIHEFVNLQLLMAQDNLLTTATFYDNPDLISLNLSSNAIDNLGISENEQLMLLWVSNNQLPALDLSQFNHLQSLHLDGNGLTELNIKNNNNTNIGSFQAQNNPDLSCIKVDDEDYANSQNNWIKDETTIYSEDCMSLSISEIELRKLVSVYPNPVRSKLNIETSLHLKSVLLTNIVGQQIKLLENISEVDISALQNGIYFLKIETEEGSLIKKIVKE